jgi:hypothetical protein
MGGFLLGLIIGSSMGSSSPTAPPSSTIYSIPLRCLGAFEINDQEYKDCRWPQLSYETGLIMYGSERRIYVERSIAWELKALKEIKEAQEKKDK